MQQWEDMPRRPGRPKRNAEGNTSLIDWQEPENNAHVLDWRERAHGFGLMPVSDGDEPDHVVLPASRAISR